VPYLKFFVPGLFGVGVVVGGGAWHAANNAIAAASAGAVIGFIGVLPVS
jgi:hypothetical protein